jgi:pyruvate-formate lyase
VIKYLITSLTLSNRYNAHLDIIIKISFNQNKPSMFKTLQSSAVFAALAAQTEAIKIGEKAGCPFGFDKLAQTGAQQKRLAQVGAEQKLTAEERQAARIALAAEEAAAAAAAEAAEAAAEVEAAAAEAAAVQAVND